MNKPGLNLKVRVKSNGDYKEDSNYFFINNQCKTYTASAIAVLWTHYLPASPPAANEIVFDAKNYFTGGGSDVSVCPPTYSILKSALAYGGSFVSLDGSDNLKVDVNTKLKETDFQIKLSLPDTNVVTSNNFDVEVICASSGYTWTNHASLV